MVKLDLVLRGLAYLPYDGELGLLPPEISWVELHDMCRGRGSHLTLETALKQRWVNDKVGQLEALRLLRRTTLPGRRSEIRVLCDRGDGSPMDDPGATGDQYVTFLGNLVRYDRIGSWNSATLSAYLAAMNAERYARADASFSGPEGLKELPVGGGRWMRPLAWFNDERVSEVEGSTVGRPAEHIRFPFSERTLRRGIVNLRADNFIAVQDTEIDPRTGKGFRSGFSRSLYYNAFHLASFDESARAYNLIQQLDREAERRRPSLTIGLR